MEEGEEVHEVKSGLKELRLVIKGDVSGSVEVIEGTLQGIGNKDAVVKIDCEQWVGNVSENDHCKFCNEVVTSHTHSATVLQPVPPSPPAYRTLRLSIICASMLESSVLARLSLVSALLCFRNRWSSNFLSS